MVVFAFVFVSCMIFTRACCFGHLIAGFGVLFLACGVCAVICVGCLDLFADCLWFCC